jgi:glycosyltransferase involved in cell wall biosynthesis
MSAPPAVSVIIPVRNDPDSLGRCLDALRAQTFPAGDFEVIVVDNASTQDLGGVRRGHPEARWFRDEGSGSYSARNAGIREARGSVIAFTDADCIPDPRWLETGVAALGSGAGVVGGELVWLDPVGRGLNSWEILETVMFALGSIRQLIEERGFAITANLFTRREAFDRVGMFDDKLRSAGDREWVQRAVAGGLALRYCGEAIVRHPRRSTARDFLRKQRRLVGGRLDLLRRSKPGPAEILADLRKISLLDGRLYRVIFGDPRAKGMNRRMRLFGAGVLVAVVTTAEKLRILCGGSPSRGA